jgi:predicted house-cleaning noncanonical NTP pyrophosphatase (MazG superfamily)
MKEYHKLIRDRIPEIIDSTGRSAVIRTLSDEEYPIYLEAKLDEEVGEYHRDQNLEELADVLEVVYALADRIGTRKELMDIFEKKHRDRGGFSKGYFLVSTTDEGE